MKAATIPPNWGPGQLAKGFGPISGLPNSCCCWYLALLKYVCERSLAQPMDCIADVFQERIVKVS